MKYLAAVAMVFASGCMTPPIQFGGKSSREAQHETLTHYTPPALVSADRTTGEVRVARIRVYADDDFRAQNVHWERTFDDQLAYANEVLAPLLGLRLEPEYRQWHHHAPGASLEEGLVELQRLDPGSDVLSVVGLTSSLALVSGNFEQLGIATRNGRHMLLRGYADREERRGFERAFPDVPEGEREALYVARRRHKTAAVLLHELGHNLGVGHEEEATTLMNATYSDHSSSFSDTSRQVMRATLDLRWHRASTAAAAPARASHPQLVVRLDAQQRAIIGGQPVDDTTLGDLFRMSFTDDPDTEVVVKAVRGTPNGTIVRVLDQAKAAGLTHVGVEVLPDR